ncbi:DsrE family protein [Listeria costaricensis]|uniref:DsrE family protein n=1 Tax=Listeria costaricensis TaxID=2026604 RepID=UPI000C06AAA6|nr:DsrE family protein [Listeria costaricensis]
MNILLHINDAERFPMLKTNIKYLNKAEFDGKITVVANGGAVKKYYEADEQKFLETLADRVEFIACRNSLAVNHLQAETLPKMIEIVPNGILEVVERQAEGYGYIKV